MRYFLIAAFLVGCGGAQKPKPLHQQETWRRNQNALAQEWEREMRRDRWRDAMRIRAMLEGADVIKACWYNKPDELVCNTVRMHRP